MSFPSSLDPKASGAAINRVTERLLNSEIKENLLKFCATLNPAIRQQVKTAVERNEKAFELFQRLLPISQDSLDNLKLIPILNSLEYYMETGIFKALDLTAGPAATTLPRTPSPVRPPSPPVNNSPMLYVAERVRAANLAAGVIDPELRLEVFYYLANLTPYNWERLWSINDSYQRVDFGWLSDYRKSDKQILAELTGRLAVAIKPRLSAIPAMFAPLPTAAASAIAPMLARPPSPPSPPAPPAMSSASTFVPMPGLAHSASSPSSAAVSVGMRSPSPGTGTFATPSPTMAAPPQRRSSLPSAFNAVTEYTYSPQTLAAMRLWLDWITENPTQQLFILQNQQQQTVMASIELRKIKAWGFTHNIAEKFALFSAAAIQARKLNSPQAMEIPLPATPMLGNISPRYHVQVLQDYVFFSILYWREGVILVYSKEMQLLACNKINFNTIKITDETAGQTTTVRFYLPQILEIVPTTGEGYNFICTTLPAIQSSYCKVSLPFIVNGYKPNLSEGKIDNASFSLKQEQIQTAFPIYKRMQVLYNICSQKVGFCQLETIDKPEKTNYLVINNYSTIMCYSSLTNPFWLGCDPADTAIAATWAFSKLLNFKFRGKELILTLGRETLASALTLYILNHTGCRLQHPLANANPQMTDSFNAGCDLYFIGKNAINPNDYRFGIKKTGQSTVYWFSLDLESLLQKI